MKKIVLSENRVYIEIVICLILLAMALFSFLMDISILSVPDFLITRIDDVEGLFLTLFSVQASISAISIAIVSIITSVLNETKYGIPVSQYISNLKSPIFKLKVLIISGFLITGINYCCVSFAWFNLSLSMFVASIVLNVLLVNNVHVIFLGKTRIQEEILNFVVTNYDNNIILSLAKETMDYIEKGNSLAVKENYEALKKIFEKEAKRNNYVENKVLDQLSNAIGDIFSKVSRQHDSRKTNDCILFICDIYEIANKNTESPLYLKIWDYISSDYFSSLKDLEFECLRDDYVYIKLRAQLYKNIRGQTEEIIKMSSLKYYSAWTYSSLLRDDNAFTGAEAERIKQGIYTCIATNVYYTKETNKAIKNTYITELCLLHKCIINIGDNVALRKLYFDHSTHFRNNNESNVICVTTLSYLYYILCKEPLLNGKTLQAKAREILVENKASIANFYYHMDLLALSIEYYSFIQDMMRNWEYMEENKAKWMIIDNAVTDFFIFSAISKFWEREFLTKIVETLFPGGMFSIYSRYFSDKEGQSLIEAYNVYNDLFGSKLKESQVKERISVLKNVFDERYKQEELADGIKNAITAEDIEVLKNTATNIVNSVIETSFAHFSLQQSKKESNPLQCKEHIAIFVANIPYLLVERKEFESYFAKYIEENMITLFLNTIFGAISFQEISYNNKNKQSTLINMVRALAQPCDVIIGDCGRYWNEADKTLLVSFTSQMKHVNYPNGYNRYFILDSQSIEFAFSNIRVEFEDVPWEDILDKCQQEKDRIAYNVTNNLYIPFGKDELKEHIHNIEKRMVIYADVSFRLSSNKVGAGIEIVLE